MNRDTSSVQSSEKSAVASPARGSRSMTRRPTSSGNCVRQSDLLSSGDSTAAATTLPVSIVSDLFMTPHAEERDPRRMSSSKSDARRAREARDRCCPARADEGHSRTPVARARRLRVRFERGSPHIAREQSAGQDEPFSANCRSAGALRTQRRVCGRRQIGEECLSLAHAAMAVGRCSVDLQLKPRKSFVF